MEHALPAVKPLNRHKLIIPPANAKRVKAPATKNLLKRHVAGSLKRFLDLPLDIIYEIVSFLNPTDLLTLARLSREFRALFISRSSLAIWKRVLSCVPDLPPCPEDLSEPAYASLMFEKFCMACGSSRGTIVPRFEMRTRFCATCAKFNYISGNLLNGSVQELACTLVPHWSSGNDSEDDDDDDYVALYCLLFFKPEIDLTCETLSMIANSPELVDGVAVYMQDRQAIAKRMMEEGRLMQAWSTNAVMKEIAYDISLSNSRYAKLEEQMLAIGWEEKFFPRADDTLYFEEWEKYTRQPKEFSLRSWKIIRPKLQPIYERIKMLRMVEDLYLRLAERYIDYRNAETLEKRIRMPGFGDLTRLNFFVDFVEQHYEACSDDQIESFMDSVIEHCAPLIELVTTTLALEVALDAKGSYSQIKDLSQDTVKKVLSKGSTLFLCGCFSCEVGTGDNVLSYENSVDHMFSDAFVRHTWDVTKPRSDPLLIAAAQAVLTALKLPLDCTMDDVLALGDLVCRCGHHEYDGPLPFNVLVKHVFNQYRWFSLTVLDFDHKSSHLAGGRLVNGHAPEYLSKLIGVASSVDEDEVEPKDKNTTTTTTTTTWQTDIPHSHFCRRCYQIRNCIKYTRYEMASYHLKYKHGVEESRDDDFQTVDVLGKVEESSS